MHALLLAAVLSSPLAAQTTQVQPAPAAATQDDTEERKAWDPVATVVGSAAAGGAIALTISSMAMMFIAFGGLFGAMSTGAPLTLHKDGFVWSGSLAMPVIVGGLSAASFVAAIVTLVVGVGVAMGIAGVNLALKK